MDGNAKVNLILELKNKLRTGLSQAKQQVGSKVAEMKDMLKGIETSHIQAFSSMGAQVPLFGRALSLIGNPYTLIIAGLVSLAAVYSKASRMASDFNASMLKANVTAQESNEQFKQTSDFILDTAAKSRTANALQGAPTAYNVLLSSGMEKQNALDTINPTLQAAKAGFTDIETVANAAANSMNSAGIKDANRIYDILFATVNKGKAEFKDMANYLPKIIPAAKNVGLNMEQVAGAFAYLTSKGQTSERAATLLENSFKVLGDPDKAKAFKQLGIEFYDAQGRLNPLVDIVDNLNKQLDGLSDADKSKALNSLGLDMEASGAFSAMAANAKDLRSIIDFVTNSSGEFNKAIEASSSKMDSFTQIGNAIDSSWVKIGNRVNETLGGFGEWLAPIAEKLLPKISDAFIFIWNVASDLIAPAAKVAEILSDWVTSSALVKDIASGLGQIFSTLGATISVISETITWLYDYTIKPSLYAIEMMYRLFKNNFAFTSQQDQAAAVSGNKQLPEGAALNAVKDALGLAAINDYNNAILGKTNDHKNLYAPPDKKNTLLNKNEDKKDKPRQTDRITGSVPQTVNFNIGSIINGDFVTQNQQFKNMGPAEFEKFLTNLFMRYQQNAKAGYSE